MNDTDKTGATSAAVVASEEGRGSRPVLSEVVWRWIEHLRAVPGSTVPIEVVRALEAERANPTPRHRLMITRDPVIDAIRTLIEWTGDDPDRPGLRETPARVANAWREWAGGYDVKPEELLKTFEDGAERVDEMVIVKGIPVVSKCEHHLADIIGNACVAYIPEKKIVGLSKLARVVDAYARRLQVQERLTNEVADCINDTLSPIGVGVLIEATHGCMLTRGVRAHGSTTVTCALRGAMRTDISARSEFLRLADK